MQEASLAERFLSLSAAKINPEINNPNSKAGCEDQHRRQMQDFVRSSRRLLIIRSRHPQRAGAS
jgi:hypothetical protein